MGDEMNKHIRCALAIAGLLIRMADDADAGSADDGCAVLGCVMRDCAYKLKAVAEREREVHRRRGIWMDTGFEPQNGERKFCF